MATLIDRMNARAHNPDLATDEGHDIYDAKGRPVLYVARPPATLEMVTAAEERLGFRLPDLLRQLYVEVGNGGYGPGYGLIGLPGGATRDREESVVGLYLDRRKVATHDPERAWPEGLLLICDWGCAIYSGIDCTKPEAPVVRYNPNADENLGVPGYSPESFFPERASFAEWLEAWLDGASLFYLPYGDPDE